MHMGKLPQWIFMLAALCIMTAQLPHVLPVGGTSASPDEGVLPEIDVWYGRNQEFGRHGTPQKWINILGRISPSEGIASFTYSLNGLPEETLTIGPDLHRLAMPGDFNIEIDVRELESGINSVIIKGTTQRGKCAFDTVTVRYYPGSRWPLPYTVDWKDVSSIQEAVQVVDGLWKLTENGLRTVEPYYDRVIAVGDTGWTDYEVTAEVILHDFLPPHAGAPNYNVTHFGIGGRWRGHTEDGLQPSRQWYPLGAATEFQLSRDLKNCRWRILGDNRTKTEQQTVREIRRGDTYIFKLRVETLPGPATQYSVKMWRSVSEEPETWDLTGREGEEDLQSGCVLFVAHHTDVTIGRITATPIF